MLILVIFATGDPAGPTTGLASIQPSSAFGRKMGGAPISGSLLVVIGGLLLTAWRLAAGHRSMFAAFARYGLPVPQEPVIEPVEPVTPGR